MSPQAQARRKGKVGELEAAKEIRRLFGVEARRGNQFCGGPESPDIVCDIPGIHFEVKRRERLRIMDAVNQAVDDCGSNIPIVLTRSNGNPWLAIIRLDDLPAAAAQLYLTKAENA